MRRGFRRGDAALLVLLALVGAWVGHNVVYVTVHGGGVVGELTNPVHVYMAPLGAVLLIAAALCGMAWARALSGLTARLERLRLAIRGRPLDRCDRAERCRAGRSLESLSVWLTLTA